MRSLFLCPGSMITPTRCCLAAGRGWFDSAGAPYFPSFCAQDALEIQRISLSAILLDLFTADFATRVSRQGIERVPAHRHFELREAAIHPIVKRPDCHRG